jgi:general secretion pathway protein E
MKSLSTKFICKVLKHYDLIDNELVQYIQVHEKDYQTRLQKKGDTKNIITAIDVISAMQLRGSSDKGQILSEELIMRTLALYWKLPFLKIDLSKLNPAVVTKKVSEPFARKHLLVPVSISKNMLFVAVVNPADKEALEAMRIKSNLKVRPVISTKTDILNVIDACYTSKMPVKEATSTHMDTLQALIANAEADLSNGTLYRSVMINPVTDEIHTDESIDAIVNLTLRYAFQQRATEIHIDPKQFHSQIYFRIDGVLYDVKRIPPKIHNNIGLVLKNQAEMDVFEKHKPQSGRMQFTVHDREMTLRISTIPMKFGEKMIIRILDPILLLRHPDDLGFFSGEHARYQSLLSRPDGIILIVGPPGCGKTTTMYSTLNALSEQGMNITTIENPIELPYDPFNQVEIHPDKGFTFETAVHTVIRQPVGILMIGDISDKETAESVVHASLSGHLVMSSLHASDAPSAFIRLIKMGIQPFLLESTVVGVIAQRLLRRVCRDCGQPYQLSQQEIVALGSPREAVQRPSVQKGVGCLKCRGTGYFGQTAVFEIMEITDEMRPLIHNNSGTHIIRETAVKAGMQTLRQQALEKMRAGITTCEEVLRVTGGLRKQKPHHFKTTIDLS